MNSEGTRRLGHTSAEDGGFVDDLFAPALHATAVSSAVMARRKPSLPFVKELTIPTSPQQTTAHNNNNNNNKLNNNNNNSISSFDSVNNVQDSCFVSSHHEDTSLLDTQVKCLRPGHFSSDLSSSQLPPFRLRTTRRSLNVLRRDGAGDNNFHSFKFGQCYSRRSASPNLGRKSSTATISKSTRHSSESYMNSPHMSPNQPKQSPLSSPFQPKQSPLSSPYHVSLFPAPNSPATNNVRSSDEGSGLDTNMLRRAHFSDGLKPTPQRPKPPTPPQQSQQRDHTPSPTASPTLHRHQYQLQQQQQQQQQVQRDTIYWHQRPRLLHDSPIQKFQNAASMFTNDHHLHHHHHHRHDDIHHQSLSESPVQVHRKQSPSPGCRSPLWYPQQSPPSSSQPTHTPPPPVPIKQSYKLHSADYSALMKLSHHHHQQQQQSGMAKVAKPAFTLLQGFELMGGNV